MLKYLTSAGTPIVLGDELARGGEGTIHPVENRKDLVAKLYGPTPHPGYEQKLSWMRTHPPENSLELKQSAVLAWPIDLLYDENRRCVGYLMNYVQDAHPVLDVFNPRRRAQKFPDFNRKLIYQTAKNIAFALSKLHDRGYVVGDLNESNILVTKNGLTTIIDNDSFQVQEVRKDGIVVYPCSVGKPDYTPPELQGKALDGILRRPEHDCFSLAILLFQMLMDGNHPFRSRWLKPGEPPPLEEKINLGYFPYARKHRRIVQPPPNAPTLKILYPKVEALFRRCFTDGVHDMRMRPTAQEWEAVMAEAEGALECCSHGHYFSNHLLSCPDCTERESTVGHSLWMASSVPISFSWSNLGKTKWRPVGRAMRISAGVALVSMIFLGTLFMAGKWWMEPKLGSRIHTLYAVSEMASMPSPIEQQAFRKRNELVEHSKESGKETNSDTSETKSETKPGEPAKTKSNEDSTSTKTKPDSQSTERKAKESEKRSEVKTKKNRTEESNHPSNNGKEDLNFTRITPGAIGRLIARHTLLGHGAAVACLKYSPSSDFLATGSMDATARLWRIRDGQTLHTFPNQRKVLSVAFSPDGKTIASGSKSIYLWNAGSGSSNGMLNMKRTTTCVAFAPDGKTLASGSTDNRVRIWNVASGEPLFILEGHMGNVNCVAFSPDGEVLASGSNDNTVRLWRVSDGTLLQTLKAPCWDVTSLAFSPGGTYLAAGSRDCTIRLWHIANAKLEVTMKGHQEAVTCVDFSPDGKLLVSGSDDHTLRIWQVGSGDNLQTFKSVRAIKSISFAPNGTSVASGMSDGTVLIWGLSN